jgi:hypothetical protein
MAGILQVVSPQQVSEHEAEVLAKRTPPEPAMEMEGLVSIIRREFHDARNARYTNGISQRLIEAQRTYRGEYDPQKLRDIKAFGGSEVYSRVTPTKCRGATSVLRDLYLSGTEPPWDLSPTPVPTLPEDITAAVNGLVQSEVQSMEQQGMQITEAMVRDRLSQLYESAHMAAVKNSVEEAKESSRQLNDVLIEGRFYQALKEFLIDLPIFPIACIKGPTVRQKTKVRWKDGKPSRETSPKLFWDRISPLDLYFTPDASHLDESYVIEHVRYSRQDLYNLIGVPGYKEDEIRAVLADFKDKTQSRSWRDWFDEERESLEDRDHWESARGQLIDALEWHGCIQGQMLLDHGFSEDDIDDPEKEYMVDAWIVDRYCIKAQIAPSLTNRPNYFISSFEKIPGSIWGYGLPDILQDITSVCNTTMRSIVNNLSIASGPQVVVNLDRLAQSEDANTLYPWKRWHVIDDPLGNNGPGNKPIDFYQPQSNVESLMAVYEKFANMADEASALPKYLTGSGATGGAGRTASGLAMLMDNASKVMQNVAANVDDDILTPAIEGLYEMVMMSDIGPQLKGDETIVVKGVTVAVQKETDRMRKLEFLQMTANPMDMQIMGIPGRAAVLEDVAEELGMKGKKVVPSSEELQEKMQEQAKASQAEAAAKAGGGAPGGAPSAGRDPAMAAREGQENVTRGVTQ